MQQPLCLTDAVREGTALLCPRTALSPVLRQLWDRGWEELKGFSVLESGGPEGCFRASAALEEWEEQLLPTDRLGWV